MALDDKYSCMLDNPLIETGVPDLWAALNLAENFGYKPMEFGRTNIVVNDSQEITTYKDISFMLLEQKEKGTTAGLINKSDLPGNEELTGYVICELRY